MKASPGNTSAPITHQSHLCLLPPKIWKKIAGHLSPNAHHDSLRSLSLVCNFFRDIAQAVLFSNIRLNITGLFRQMSGISSHRVNAMMYAMWISPQAQREDNTTDVLERVQFFASPRVAPFVKVAWPAKLERLELVVLRDPVLWKDRTEHKTASARLYDGFLGSLDMPRLPDLRRVIFGATVGSEMVTVAHECVYVKCAKKKESFGEWRSHEMRYYDMQIINHFALAEAKRKSEQTR